MKNVYWKRGLLGVLTGASLLLCTACGKEAGLVGATGDSVGLSAEAFVPQEGDAAVTMQQGVLHKEAGSNLKVAAGDDLYYMVTVENTGEHDLYGTLVLPCPVFSDGDLYVTDGGVVSSQEVKWEISGLASGGKACYVAILTLPETVSHPAWTVQPQLQCKGEDASYIFVSDTTGQASFGAPEVCYQMEDATLSVWNEATASGGASNIRITVPVIEGEEVLPEEWTVEDGQIVIFLGALVPGGSKKIDFSGVIDRLDVEHITVISDEGEAVLK